VAFQSESLPYASFCIVKTAMRSYSRTMLKMIWLVIILAMVFPLVGGCDQDRNTQEGAYYSDIFEVNSRENLRFAGTAIKKEIEDECSLIGNERPIYKIARGDDEFYLLFQSHDSSGELREGAVVHSSVGAKVQISVELFLSGFNDLDDLNACKSFLEDRVRKGFSKPLTQPN